MPVKKGGKRGGVVKGKIKDKPQEEQTVGKKKSAESHGNKSVVVSQSTVGLANKIGCRALLQNQWDYLMASLMHYALALTQVFFLYKS